jgi:hypothetical protein
MILTYHKGRAMRKILLLLLVALITTGCQHISPTERMIHPADNQPKIAWKFWEVRVACNVSWGDKCEGEVSPQNEAVIPDGFSHCRTVAKKNSGPTKDAASWWWLDGNRVRIYTRACGGPIYDQYSSWVDVTWKTYIVRTSSLNDPENNCSPDVKGAADHELICW